MENKALDVEETSSVVLIDDREKAVAGFLSASTFYLLARSAADQGERMRG